MYFQRKQPIPILKVAISTLFIGIFFYLIFNLNNLNIKYNFYKENVFAIDIANEDSLKGYIPLNNIIIYPDQFDGKFTYIVQPGDTLSQIAYKFWISLKTLKSVNKLKSNIIKPWQKLIIVEEEWILYEIPKDITLKQFAKTYNLDLEKLKQINYFIEDDVVLQKGDEIFVPISEKQAIKIWLIKKPKKTYITRATTTTRTTTYRNTSNTTNYSYNWKTIVAKRYYAPNISNWFYRWHCTRYVAIKKFPYITKNKQKKLWNWNAKNWYTNAARAGYKVWQTPKIGSIVVLKYGWRYYRSYWHVAIVLQIDWKRKRLLVEEMNAVWRFIVTRRWIPMDNKIIWYIYL